MSAIKVENLTKKFKDFTAVSNLSFEVKENRVMGFLGPNGAGKTTTLRILVGLSKPSSGGIEISGERVIFGEDKANHLFGYLPEQPSFYNWMSGLEYLNFVADAFKISNKKKKINDLLAKVGLSDSKNKRIGTYSNGMKQRLGIAQALINDPKVLILDEPVSALDPIGRMEVLHIISELKKDVTVLLSTHILSDVDRICDDVAIINKGQLITVSSITELKEKYATSVLEVEFDKNPQQIVKALKDQTWVENVDVEGNKARINLKEERVLDSNIPLKFLLKYDLVIIKYGLALPEVEDLFMSLVKENK